MSVISHYHNLLAGIYGWMSGDFETKVDEYRSFFVEHGILSSGNARAIDLGCGHGTQSVALARLGFDVTAVDFSRTLLNELTLHADALPITAVEADIIDFLGGNHTADCIICMGDTLPHLSSMDNVTEMLRLCRQTLAKGGVLALGFRDYSVPLTGTARFIPVRAEADRILTCFLEYRDNIVTVTDILHELTPDGWHIRTSSYDKLRLTPQSICSLLTNAGFADITQANFARMTQIIARI